jgi:hypothetical protein
MSNTLKKITTRAKQIYAKGGTWRGAIKKAGAEYRGSKHKTKKRVVRNKRRKTSHRKKVGVVWPAAVAGSSMNGTISGHLSQAKKMLAEKIGDKETQKFTTKLKRNKRKIQKEISSLKKQYRKL